MKKLLLSLLFSFFIPGIVFATDYTQNANCSVAMTMNIDESPIDDVSANSNTAALKGAGEPDYTASGKYGGGYVFDGANDYAQITDFIGSNQDYVSICAWMYFDTSNTDDYINGYSQSAGVDGVVFIRDDTDSTTGRTDCITSLIASTSTDYRLSTATNSAPSGSWIHFCTTFSSSTNGDDSLRGYINGVEDANSPQKGGVGQMVNPAANSFLGAVSTTASNIMLDGTMDEYGYFNDVLTSTEINDIMTNGLAGSLAAVTNYPLNIVNFDLE